MGSSSAAGDQGQRAGNLLQPGLQTAPAGLGHVLLLHGIHARQPPDGFIQIHRFGIFPGGIQLCHDLQANVLAELRQLGDLFIGEFLGQGCWG